MSSAIPIRNSNDQSIPVQFNRNSFVHSQGMGGISWGGASVGSWLRDEVLMATKNKDHQPSDNFLFPQDSSNQDAQNSHPDTVASNGLGEDIHSVGTAGRRLNTSTPDPLNHDMHDPLLDHAPTYFPSLEANFCRDYTCCGRLLPTLHDLLRHYEEQHISPSPPEEPPVMRRMQNVETVSTNDVFLPFDQPAVKDDDGMAGLSGLDALNGDGFSGVPGIDDMDLDLGTGPVPSGPGGSNAQTPAFAPPSFQPLTTNTLNQFNSANNIRTKGLGNIPLNGASGRGGFPSNNGRLNASNSGGVGHSATNNNATNGNNTSAIIGSHSRLGSQQAIGSEINHLGASNHLPGNANASANSGANSNFGPGRFSNGFSDANPNGASGVLGGPSRLHNSGLTFGDDEEPTIDDPARQLYMLERSENKPFKCPVIGCEKTYKNQNGLKYHRQHGHQNQTLHLNDDGTYSIIDPLSNTPYPDGMGMEKDKPYRCEICGKRYKNLNGLKYHRAHSTH